MRSLTQSTALCSALALSVLLLAPTHLTADAWPADAGTQIWSGGEPSGIVWHERLEKLFWVHDNGYVRQMDTDGTLEYDWYIGGDLEGVTIVDPSSDYIYVGYEQGGAGVQIREFDITTGALTGDAWVFSEMSGHGNAGMVEAQPATAMPRKLSGSRLAPPIRAPSTSSRPRSASALAGLTLPP